MDSSSTVFRARWRRPDDLEQNLPAAQVWRTIVLHMVVQPESLMRRLTGRRICKGGGHIYNIYDRPPKREGICDQDGSELIHRTDDTEAVISERLGHVRRADAASGGLLPRAGPAEFRGCDVRCGYGHRENQKILDGSKTSAMIVCKSQAELEKMHHAGLVIWEVLNDLRAMVRPGVTTKELDDYAERRTARVEGPSRVQELSGISGDAMHVDQFRGGARHPLEIEAPRGG